MKEYKLNKIKNILAKGEIDQYEQFHLLPQCIQKLFSADASKSVNIIEKG